MESIPQKIMQSKSVLENYQFDFSIDKWEKETTSSTKNPKTIVKYQVDISSNISNRKWSVYRTLDDFQTVLSDLNQNCLNLPQPPKIFGLKETSQNLTFIGKEFEEHLKILIHRADVYNSIIIQEFFEIVNHFEKVNQFTPSLVFSIKNIRLEITDMLYYEKENLLFVTTAKTSNKNFIQSTRFFKNISNYFKRDNEGEIILYKINNDIPLLTSQSQSSRYVKISSLETPNEITCIDLITNEIISIIYLIIGFSNGYINIYEFNYKKDQVVISSSLLKLVKSIQACERNRKVISFGMNYTTKYIYCAFEKEYEIAVCYTEKNKYERMIPASDENIIGFAYDNYNRNIHLNNRYVCIDAVGKLMMGSVENNKKFNLHCVIFTNLKDISCFKCDFNSEKIYIGDINGNCSIIEIRTITKGGLQFEMYKTFSISLQGNTNLTVGHIVNKLGHLYEIRDIVFNKKKNEIYFALNNGIIQAYSHMKNSAECFIEMLDEEDNGDNAEGNGNSKDHTGTNCINRIITDSESTMLFVGGTNRIVYGMNLPRYYMSEMTRQDQEVNLKSIFKDDKEEKLENELLKGFRKTTEGMKRENFLQKNFAVNTNLLVNPNEQDNSVYFRGMLV